MVRVGRREEDKRTLYLQMLWKNFNAGTSKLNVLVCVSTSMRNRQSLLKEPTGNAVNQ